jgi:hypothetical protein
VLEKAFGLPVIIFDGHPRQSRLGSRPDALRLCSWLGQHGPMECFHMTKNSKGDMTECSVSYTLTGRNSPRSMPRCKTVRTKA